MADHITGKQVPSILYSCYSQKSSEGEQFVPEHIFGYTLSGSSETYLGGKPYVYKEGEFRFLRRNQLLRYTKFPPVGGEYRSISISIDQNTLRSISKEHNLFMSKPYTGENALHLKPHPLFTSYIESLTPYLDVTGTSDTSKALTGLKVREAVMILLQTNPVLKEVLFDFTEPGKIDLEAYMNENYKFNVDIGRLPHRQKPRYLQARF